MGNGVKYSSKTHCTGVSENPVGIHSYYCFPTADLGTIEIQKNLQLVSRSSFFWEVLLCSTGCLS